MSKITSAQALKAAQRGFIPFAYDPLGQPVNLKSSVLAAAANFNAPAANTAAVVTFAASGSAAHVLGGVAYSYDVTPVGGNLTIKDGTTVIFNLDIALATAGVIQFNPPLRITKNAAMVLTLAAGGSGSTGKVNALGKTTEAA